MSCEKEQAKKVANHRRSIVEDGPALLESAPSSPGHDAGAAAAVGRRSRWSKLRGTIQVANAASSSLGGGARHHHQLNREDSFLKKFSTRQSAAPYVQVDAAERAVAAAQASTADDRKSSRAADPTSVDPETGARRTEELRKQRRRNILRRLVVNPDESPMFYWLTLVTLAVLYNL